MRRPDEEMAEVLRDMCGGSVDAFDLFYARFAPFVMQVAMRMLGDRMEAEDVCHDVFLEALRRGSSYDPQRGSLQAWLSVMTKSRCLDRLRKQKRVLQSAEEEEGLSSSEAGATEELVFTRLQQQALLDALEALPANQREAVVGSYFGWRTQRELSAAWNVPIGTVKSWIRYGLNNMRKQMEKRGWLGEMESGEEARR